MMGANGGVFVALTCCLAHLLAASVDERSSGAITQMDILMKGAKPTQPDAYLCTSYKVDEEEAFIVKFEALANADTAHHILMYGCQGTGYSSENVWGCPPICRGKQQILFAWAKNAPPTQLPEGVGVRIGRRTSVQTIVLQIHYAKSFQANEKPDRSGIRLYISKEKQPYVAGIYLLMSTSFAIPPEQQKYHVDVSCQYKGNHDMVPFAYRTHSHGLGRVITGYQYNNTGYHMIGKGNPQWPQAFYPSKSSVTIKPGDKLVARCTYNSTGMTHTVYVGGTHRDEMCNFYIMFYTDASVQNPYKECYRVEFTDLVNNMPANSDVTLPPNPLLDEAAHGHNHHHHHPPPVSQPSSTPVVNQHPPHQGDLQRPGTHEAFSQERWSEFLHAGSYPHSDALMHYLNQKIYSQDTTSSEEDRSQQSASEEEVPMYIDRPENSKMINIAKRIGGEYYDDYSANDEREQGTFPQSNSGLSRNRNKAFEAMNQELKGFQHIKPHGDAAASAMAEPGYWQQQQRYPQTMSRKKIGAFPLAPRGQAPVGNRQPVETLSSPLVYQSGWPSQHINMGQVGGVATDSQGNVYIFHRGERSWERNSFDFDDNFQFKDKPIMADVVVILSREGRLIRQFGSGQFFMPHGITVDSKGNIWLTDVALHQVFKVLPGESKPNMTLGQRFVHGKDATHFCKPTDVAVLSSGDFYVSDGYCNSRVMKFSPRGVLTKEWGRPNEGGFDPQPYMFSIPHGITVAEDLGLVCVADRENGRIQCFNLEGNFSFIIKKPEFGSRLFALEYCPRHGGLLYAVNGPMWDGRVVPVKGFTISLRSNALLETWNLPTLLGLQNPHDLAVDVSGHAVYVGELNPKAVWKFQRQIPSSSTMNTVTHKATQKATSSQHPAAQNKVEKEHKVSPGAVKTQEKPSSSSSSSSSSSAASGAVGKNESVKSLAAEGLLKESTLEEKKRRKEASSSSDFTPSIIIGVLLIIPVVLLLLITLIMRWHHKGWNNCMSSMRKPKVFNLQKLLGNSHRGFDKLSQEDSDHDADVLSDSDNEEFRQPMKSKA